MTRRKITVVDAAKAAPVALATAAPETAAAPSDGLVGIYGAKDFTMDAPEEPLNEDHAEIAAQFEANHELQERKRANFVEQAREHLGSLELVSQEADFMVTSGNLVIADAARRHKIIADALIFILNTVADSAQGKA